MTGWQWLGVSIFALLGLAAVYGLGAEDGTRGHARRIAHGAALLGQMFTTIAALVGLPLAIMFLALALVTGDLP